MTLDLLGRNYPQIKFSDYRPWDLTPTECASVCLLDPDASVILDHYIYIVEPDHRRLPAPLLEPRQIAVALPASLLSQFPPERFLCDVAVYDDSLLSAQELLRGIGQALAGERQIRDFTLRLARLLLEGADIPAILSFSAVKLGAPLYVLDPSGRLLFHCGLTPQLGQEDPIVADLLAGRGISPTLYSKYSFTRLQNRLIQELEPFLFPAEGLLPRLYFRIMDRRTYLGHVAMLSPEGSYTALARACLHALADVLTLKMKGSTEQGRPLHQESFLYRLLDGSIESSEQLVSTYGETAPLLKAELRLLVMELDPATVRMEDSSGNYLLMSRQHLAEWYPTVRHICLFQRHIVALLEERYVPDILERLPQFLSSYGLFGSVSNRMSGLFPLRSYYRQSVELLRFCRADPDDDGKRLASFSRFYCQLLLGPALSQGQAQEAVLPEWLSLLRYDKAHRTSYVETLYEYLLTGNLSATAQRLHVHKNTLIYRLEKIREIAGCDLDREELRHQLYLSYLLLRSLRQEGKDLDLFPGINLVS